MNRFSRNFFLAFISLSSVTFAALPPLAQSSREIQAVLADGRFYESLGSAEVVKEIIRTQNGFLVMTQNYAMKVDVKYTPRGETTFAGPAQFTLEFHAPVSFN